ncbi:MAG TPA: zinc ribbon domain-containing protein [Pyrinomonadaceae bacterium]|jgi:putative FmdB family regulatory protein
MPIYEYTCRKCQTHVEILQKMTDKPLTRCKKCGGKLEKQWSQTGFQFKGTGWYVTDYAGKQADKKETEPKGEAKAEPKTEAKAEAKSASKTGGETKPAAAAKTSNSAAKGD